MDGYKNRELDGLQKLITLASDVCAIDNDIVQTIKRIEDDLKRYSWFKGDELITELLSYIVMHAFDMAFISGADIGSIMQFVFEKYEKHISGTR
jgi:hypothetical protein